MFTACTRAMQLMQLEPQYCMQQSVEQLSEHLSLTPDHTQEPIHRMRLASEPLSLLRVGSDRAIVHLEQEVSTSNLYHPSQVCIRTPACDSRSIPFDKGSTAFVLHTTHMPKYKHVTLPPLSVLRSRSSPSCTCATCCSTATLSPHL